MLLLGLFAMAIFVRIPCLIQEDIEKPHGLEDIYLVEALSFLYGHGMNFSPELRTKVKVHKFGSGLKDDFDDVMPGPIYYMPGYPALEAFMIKVFGESMLVLRVAGVIFNAVAVVLFFVLIYILTNGSVFAATIGAIFLAFDQSIVPLSGIATADTMQPFMITSWLLFLVLYLKRPKLVWLFWFSIFFALHALFRLDFIPLLALLMLLLFLRHELKTGFHIGLAGFVGLLFVLFPIAIRNHTYTGSFHLSPSAGFVMLVGSMDGETIDGKSGDHLVIDTVKRKCGISNFADPRFSRCAKDIFINRISMDPYKYVRQMMRRTIWSFRKAFLYSGGECFYEGLGLSPILGPLIKGHEYNPSNIKWWVVLYEIFKFSLVLLYLVGVLASIWFPNTRIIAVMFVTLAVGYIIFHIPMHVESRFILPARIFLFVPASLGIVEMYNFVSNRNKQDMK